VIQTRTTKPKRVDDPLTAVTECIPLSAVEFPNRGRYVCRLLVNGDLVHETTFEVDWPRPAHAQGQMSPQSFARALARLKEKEPGLDDEGIGRACGFGHAVLARMATTFEGLDPVQMQEVVMRICVHYRLRPEDFFEGRA
jgi:hypothetical protein